MKTICVQIGNSDDKLSQSEWSTFVQHVDSAIRRFAVEVYFFGGAANWMPWQNVAWVFSCEDTQALKDVLYIERVGFKQDSIAWLEGETQFI